MFAIVDAPPNSSRVATKRSRLPFPERPNETK
jgi:hypothetical protein